MDNFAKNVRRAAVADPARAAAMFNKQELYDVITQEAAGTKGPCETSEQARVRVMNSPDGAQIYKAYSLAKAAPETFAKKHAAQPLPGRDVLDEVQRRAEEIAREQKIPIVQARARAWTQELKQKYDTARRAASGD
jgi:hypothetical protein